MWYGKEPVHGKLPNGQWIPDALFISALFLHKKTARSWTWLMENAKTVRDANLRTISLDELERLTDLYLWGNVGADHFAESRSKKGRGTWWKAGQPAPRTPRTRS